MNLQEPRNPNDDDDEGGFDAAKDDAVDDDGGDDDDADDDDADGNPVDYDKFHWRTIEQCQERM